MNTISYKQFCLLAVFCIFAVLSFGQAGAAESESLAHTSDSIVKKEIASFTKKGGSMQKEDSLPKPVLTELPITHCSDNSVHLSWSTFTSSVSTFINIYFKGESPNKMVDSIFLVTHSHFYVRIPRDACKELAVTNTCNFSGGGKKAKFFSPYFKAFYSADKKRLYIYMQGGAGESKYEVTWVIVGDKYYTRVMDAI